ncbi:c-type cytochrome [Iodobacter ciconiae]|uniref:C-type cytochrome n=1 Tax=Iodobacter ciconiae TaxID=2496266 RepID=A0A3S8ZV66_9NEIS|nr:c-type cytochrome [Iodobacter ciconiae]AZN37410.1 c-type cytochrome [Iodobacter ciconiae]
MVKYLLLLFLPFALQARAEDGAKVVAKYNCLGCHAIDTKIVGPSYRDVAARYRGQKDAEAMLMKEVRNGLPGGKWGKIPMPAQQIGEKDLKIIVRWVLSH